MTAPLETSHAGKPAASLLLLPGELRNRIWRLLVVHDGALPAFSKAGSLQDRVSVPPLAHTCRSVRHEVLPIYYSENVFNYESTANGRQDRKNIARWLTAVRVHLEDVTSLTMQSDRLHRPYPRPYPETPQWCLSLLTDAQVAAATVGGCRTEYGHQCSRKRELDMLQFHGGEREHRVEVVLEMLRTKANKRDRGGRATVCIDCSLQYSTELKRFGVYDTTTTERVGLSDVWQTGLAHRFDLPNLGCGPGIKKDWGV